MARNQHITTAAQLLKFVPAGGCELVRGELIMMTQAGFEHGRVAARIRLRLAQFVETERLGVVTGTETGFWIGRDPDTVRAADVALVRSERVPAEKIVGFFPGAPDLAVEVVSPHDRPGEVQDKVDQWLAAGCRGVWVVDWTSQSVAVHRTDGVRMLSVNDSLTGDDILPNFSLSVAEIFGS